MDDDVFLVSEEALRFAESALAQESVAAVSFKPRLWWEHEVDGNRYPVMGSYCVCFRPDVVRLQKLSFRTRRTEDVAVRNGSGLYDTGDYVSEQLYRRGYQIVVPDEATRGCLARSFSAVSSGFVTWVGRSFLRKRYRLKLSRHALASQAAENRGAMERCCGIAATIALYRSVFEHEPSFSDFFHFDELHRIAEGAHQDRRASLVPVVTGYQSLLETLLQLGQRLSGPRRAKDR